jgi:hypothetical protein
MNTFVARALVLVLLSAGVVWAADNSPLPKEALEAKTIFLVNRAHNVKMENGADKALTKWGRFKRTDDEESADIILVFTKGEPLSGNSEQKKKDDGSCCDTSYSLSFSSKYMMKAYLKGKQTAFFSQECGGEDCINEFRKKFPR